MSPYESRYLDRALAWARGDWYAAYTSAKQLQAIAPKSSFAAYIAARSATPINRPREAVEGLEQLDIKVKHTNGYYSDLTQALHMLGEHERELEIAKQFRSDNAGLMSPLTLSARALSALGRGSDLHEVINAATSMPAGGSGGASLMYATSIRELEAHGFPQLAKEFAEELLTYLQTSPDSASSSPVAGLASGRILVTQLRIAALMTLGRYREAKTILDSAVAGGEQGVGQLTAEGELAALLGDRAQAEKDFARLATMQRPYDRGANVFGQAEIAARLGRKAQAVQLLRIAISRGRTYPSVHAIPAFDALKGFGPYEDLIKPKG